MLTFLLANLIVGLSAFLFSRSLFKDKGLPDPLLAIFVLFFSQIIITELILGIANILTLPNLLALNVGTLVIAILFSKDRRTLFSRRDILPQGIFSSISQDKIILFAASLLIGFALVKSIINLRNPPFGWDSLTYHFTFPAEWIRHGSLENPMIVFGFPAPTYYTMHSELIYLWLMWPFGGAFIADLGQLPFWIAAFFASYGIARKIGLDKNLSLCCGLVFLATPAFFKQIEIGYNDIMMASLFLIALNFLILLQKDYNIPNLTLAGLSMGLLFGMKATSVFWGGILFLFLCYVVAKGNRPFKDVILFLILVFLLGGFTYVKNFLLSENPFYPMEIKLLGLKLFPGIIVNTRHAWYNVTLTNFFFHERLGGQFLLLTTLSVFLGPLVGFLRSKDKLFILSLPFILTVLFFFTPAMCARFFFHVIGVGCIVGIYLLDTLKFKKRMIKGLVFVIILASMAEVAKHGELIASLVTSLVLFVLLIPLLNTSPLRIGIAGAGCRNARKEPRALVRAGSIKKKTKLLLGCVAVLVLPFLIWAEADYAKNEYPRYTRGIPWEQDMIEGWKWINDNTGAGKNIAYTGMNAPYPLYGTKLKNEVFYVSVNEKPPLLHAYSKYTDLVKDHAAWFRSMQEPGHYRENADYKVWLKNLNEKKTDYLFISALWGIANYPIEDEWAAVHPEEFELVFSRPKLRIYGVK